MSGVANDDDPGHEPLDPRLRRSVVALLTSVFCTSTAMAALTITLGKQVFDLTGRELDLGLLGLAEFAPALLLVFVTGPLADRFDRRRIGTIAITVEALCCLALGVYAGTAPTSVLPIFVLVIAYGTARAFAMPATRSLPADTVPAPRLPWLVARQSVTWQSAAIVGPVLAGFLYAADVQLPFFMAVGLLAVGAVSLAFVHPDARDAEVARREAAAVTTPATGPGSEEASRDAPVCTTRSRVFASCGAIRSCSASSRSTSSRCCSAARSRSSPRSRRSDSVWARSASDGSRRGRHRGRGGDARADGPPGHAAGRRTTAFAVAIFGVGTIVLGFTTSFVVAWIALAVLSGADAVSVFIRGTLVPLVTPADKRGRVLAVEMVFIGASNELGAFESGVAGQLLGPAAAVVLGGAATVGIAAAWASLFPAFRDVDRFPVSVN